MSPRTPSLVLHAQHPGWIDIDDGPRRRLRRAFVGRDRELRRVLDAMRDPRLVAAAVSGERGVGKTRLLDEAIRHADARYVPLRINASPATAHTPLAAFAGHLPPALLTPPINAYALAAAAETLRRAAGGRDLLLVVDDIGHLDDASVTLLADIARQDGVFVLVSLYAGVPAPGPIAALSHAGLIDWLELSPLGRDDVADLVCGALGGQIDGLLIQRLWAETTGNPLLVRELVTAQLDAGTLTDDAGLWRLGGDLAVPVGLVRLIHERTSTLPSASLRALELLAVGEPIWIDDLCAATSPSAVEAAEAHGSIRVEYAAAGDAHCRLTYPLYGSVLRAAMPRVRASQRRAELAELADRDRSADARATDARTTDARTTDAPTTDAPTRAGSAGAGTRTRLATAAWDAWDARDIRRTRDLSLNAVLAGSTLDVIEPLGYSLMLTGSPERAEVLLAEVSTSVAVERFRISRVRAINAHIGLGQPAQARALAEAELAAASGTAARFDAIALRALLEFLDGDTRTATASTHDATGPGARPATFARGSVIRALSGIFGDRPDSGQELSDAVVYAGTLGTDACPEMPWLASIVELASVHGLIWNGDLAAARQRADDGYATAVACGRIADIVVCCLLQAVVAGLRGAAADQISHSREGLALARDAHLHPFIPVLLAARAHGEALGGCPTVARTALVEAQARRDQSLAVLRSWIDLFAIWADPDGSIRARTGRAETARDRAAATGASGFEAIALHQLVRLGAADPRTGDCHMRLRELAATGTHHAADAYADHAAAVLDRDIVALGHASARFERMGAFMDAAEASVRQSQLYLAAGRRNLATAAVTRSLTLTAACTGLNRLPAIATVDVARITSRECEIATLAADGLSSKEIGRRLVLSVRTVENHLQRVYRKLGIGTRAELAQRRPMLAAVADTVSGSR